MKRIIRILSSLAMLLSLFTLSAKAEGTQIKSIQFLEGLDYCLSKQIVYFDVVSFAHVEPANVPQSEFVITSSDESVIAPAGGRAVRAAGVGKAVITISSASNPDIKASHEFEIIEPEVPSEMRALTATEKTTYAWHVADRGFIAVTYGSPRDDLSTTWESSDTSVVHVDDDGTHPSLVAFKPGTATVTATSTANPKLSVKFKITVSGDIPDDKYTITVRNPLSNPGESEALPDPLELNGSEEKKLLVLVKYDNIRPLPTAFTNGTLFKSDLIEVTRYDSAFDYLGSYGTDAHYLTVRAKKAGTGTCAIGNTTFNVKTTGNFEHKDVERIWFTEPSYTINVGQNFVLIPHVEPKDADSKITITSSNPKVVSNQDNLLFGEKTGTVTMTATAENGVKASCTIHVTFTDVPYEGKYYSAPVYWAVNKGITNGYKDKDGLSRTFKPQNNCTREAVVTFLWRLAGKPEPKSMKSPFTDVKDSSKYYYKAVLWAAEKKIAGGYKDGTFKPDDTCLREHVVTFLYRYAGKPNPGVSKNPFNDVSKSDYYYNAALWANAKGIAKGYSDGPHAGGFGPKLDCLREHVVTFLYRYGK